MVLFCGNVYESNLSLYTLYYAAAHNKLPDHIIGLAGNIRVAEVRVVGYTEP